MSYYENFQIAEADLIFLKSNIFSVPLFTQEKVLENFKLLDKSHEHILKLILHSTNFLETYLFYYVTQVLLDICNNKTVFNGKKEEFMSNGLNLFQSFAIGSKEESEKILSKLKLSRIIYENIIEEFSDFTKGYLSASNKVATIHNKLQKTNNQKTINKLLPEYEKYLKKTTSIENKIKCIDPQIFYGILQQINLVKDQYHTYKNEIATPYLRVVYSVGLKYSFSTPQFLKNFQEGCVGLLRAISSYNPDKNMKFSSYSKIWVKQKILLSHKIDNFILLPISIWYAYSKISPFQEEPIEHIASKTGYSIKKVQNVLNKINYNKSLISIYSTISLTGHSQANNLEEFTPTIEKIYIDKDFEEKKEDQEKIDHLENLLEVLDTNEKNTLYLNYGALNKIENKVPHEEILKERIRQKLSSLKI